MAAIDILKSLKAGSQYSPQGKVAGKIFNGAKKLALGTGALFGAVLLYFLKLGAAAFKGFIIGATIGGTAGAVAGGVIGFNIGLALAPFTFGISIPVFTALGAVTGGFVGATVGGLAGGLIGLGIASGSATAISMGVGAGIGGTVGAIVGYIAAAGAYAALVGLCASVFAPCAALGIFTPAVGAVGGIAGAFIGAAVGAFAGYVVGKYVIQPVQQFVTESIGITGNVGSAIGSFFASAGSAITGAVAAAWNGITSAVGSALGGIAKGVGFAVEGISSVGTAVGAVKVAAIPVAAATGTLTVTSLLTGINTNSSFFNPEIDNPYQIVGDNEFFTIYKTADPIRLQNENLPIEITYTINLTAKETPITITGIGDFIQVRGQNGIFNLTTDVNGNSFASPCSNSPPGNMTPGETWTCQIKILAENSATINFDDSHVINVVSVTADPNGAEDPINDFATSTVDIGNPPSSSTVPPPGGSPPPGGIPGCPSGWPTTGYISQGPEAGSHLTPLPYGNEAIDIGTPIGTTVFATVTGTILYNGGSGVNQELAIIPTHTCVNSSGGVLRSVYYFHLESVCPPIPLICRRPGELVNAGDAIATSGMSPNGFEHLHYQFNESNTPRVFKLELPYIPQALPRRDCTDANVRCNITITSAP